MAILKYPCKTMNITQSYLGNFSHFTNRTGEPFDYPIDEAGIDRGRDYFYAPCDLRVVRIYGVKTTGDNTIWLESVDAVNTPSGKHKITIMVTHPEDDDLLNIKVGQLYKQGEKIFREGSDGNSTGNHFHMSVATGTISGTGWIKNNKGAWVIRTTGVPIKPEDAFYVDEDTVIKDSGGLVFERVIKLTKAEAKRIVKEKVGLSDKTLEYIADDYRWGDELIIKLAEALSGM